MMTTEILRRLTLPALLGLVLICSGFSVAHAAVDNIRTFDLPADTAERSLKRLSAQADREVLFPTDAVAGLRTVAVRGQMTAREALSRMLAGTGLAVVEDANTGAFSVNRVSAPGAFVQPLEGAPARDDVVSLSMFEVTGERDEGYRSTQTISGTRTLENLRDTPNSISVMNRELIDDLVATTAAELMTYSILGEQTDNMETTAASYQFRGLAANISLRNGVKWLVVMDTHNVERVEVLRGPNALLYGEASPGGVLNQVTKQPQFRDFQRANVVVGSDDLYRFEFDINRRITDKLAVRASFAYQDAESYINHATRTYEGGYVALVYKPFTNTNINVNLTLDRDDQVASRGLYADQFSITERLGTAPNYTATTGGWTLIPALNEYIYTPNVALRRRSSGTGMAIADASVLPRGVNFWGPDTFVRRHYSDVSVSIDQKIGDLAIQLSTSHQTLHRNALQGTGSSAAAIYVDTNPLRPDGRPNPYLNQRYVEHYYRRLQHAEPLRHWRATAVYDLKLPFMTQRIVASGSYQDDTPDQRYFSEYVDPASPEFTGTLVNANTLAAYQGNITVMNANRFYRRYYLRDGDNANLTRFATIPGRTAFIRDTGADGTAGRLTNRKFRTPAYGIGASGSYFGGRLRSLVGWRHDSFYQDPERDFHNYVTGERYQLDSTAPVRTRIDQGSYNYGGVFHVAKFLSAYANYAESVALSSGIGGAGLIPNTVRGPSLGDGYEYGLRWSFWEGRLESNWTYYITNSLNVAANPAVPAVVRQNELAEIFDDINPTGADTQVLKSSGFEFETVANLTRNWRLMWNFATNDVETSQRYPALHYFQARAREMNVPTPETDAFLATVPEGTPIPGYTKIRTNLVTNYRFSDGPLKGFNIGGGFQYRDRGYRGNYDLNGDTVAEEQWTPGYFLWNFMAGYRTRIFERTVNLSLSVNNVFDKTYYRSLSLASGVWGAPRSFRLAARIEL